MAIGKRPEANVRPDPMAQDPLAPLYAPIFGAAQSGVISMGMRDQIAAGLSPRVDVRDVIGSDQPVGLQQDSYPSCLGPLIPSVGS